MTHVFKLSKCTKKSMIYTLLLIVILVILQILWSVNKILNFPSDIKSILSTYRLNKTKRSDIKYIILWSKYTNYIKIKSSEVTPTPLNCSSRNCVFTKDKGLFDDDYTKFDAVLFSEEFLHSGDRPGKRDDSQIYIFNALESSYSAPACEPKCDEFFNLTLTYRLDSDIVWTYFIVRNLKGAFVAPRATVKWQRSHYPVDAKIRTILAGKKKAAAWLVSHCKADSLRDEYLTRLQEHLFHFGLKIDVYGKCTREKCPKNDCNKMIKDDYFFYMAFENSLAKDYVTEKILHGYDNFAVPIVYGGANYSRFLPPGSYINARETHPYNLAFNMYQAMKTPLLYETYFTWTNLYTISTNFWNQHPLCKLCAKLQQRKVEPAKKNFRMWWNGLNGFKWCLSKEYWIEISNVNLDDNNLLQNGNTSKDDDDIENDSSDEDDDDDDCQDAVVSCDIIMD